MLPSIATLTVRIWRSFPWSRVANLDAVVVRVAPGSGRSISAGVFQGMDLQGKAVLVSTGWDRHWRTDQYLSGHPFLTGDAAAFLRDSGAVLVGIDSLNIDDIADRAGQSTPFCSARDTDRRAPV